MEDSALEEKYVVEDAVGSGNYGEVVKVRCKNTGAKLVCKRVDLTAKNEKQRNDAHNEVKVMSKINHPNIIRFEEAFVHGPVLHIVMEYADNMDLEKVLLDHIKHHQVVPENQIMNYFVQICLGLRQLHKQHLMHRDLKSANVFLTSTGAVKLGDFGFAKQLNYTMALTSTVCGTPYYFAPELCQKLPYNNKADIWSLGVILYEMINLRKPFEARNLPELRKRVVFEEPQPFVATHISEDLKALCNALLRKSSSARPSVDSILAMPYVRSYLTNFTETLKEMKLDAERATQNIISQHPRREGEELPPVKPSQPMNFGKERVKMNANDWKALKQGEIPANFQNASPPRAAHPPSEPPQQLHSRPRPNVRDQIAVDCPLNVVGELTDAVLHQENMGLLQQDVEEVLSFDIGEPQSDQEQLLRDELGDERFLRGIEVALKYSEFDPNSPEAAQLMKELLKILGEKQYLLTDLQRISVQFEIEPEQ